MIIAEQRTWKCGRYTVRQSLRPDNPAFPRYIVMRGEKIVGCSFSVPDTGWCEFVERFANLDRYVERSKPLKKRSYRMGGEKGAEKSRRAAQVNKILSVMSR